MNSIVRDLDRKSEDGLSGDEMEMFDDYEELVAFRDWADKMWEKFEVSEDSASEDDEGREGSSDPHYSPNPVDLSNSELTQLMLKLDANDPSDRALGQKLAYNEDWKSVFKDRDEGPRESS